MFVDNLNTAKWSVRSAELSFVGRTTSFHEGTLDPSVAVLNAAPRLAVKSDTPIRIASRKPSRPPPDERLPVVNGWLKGGKVIELPTEVAAFTLPVFARVATVPKPTVALSLAPVPLMVIRIEGRK